LQSSRRHTAVCLLTAIKKLPKVGENHRLQILITSPIMAPEQQPKWEWPAYTRVIHRSVYEAIDPTNPVNSKAGKVVLVTSELPEILGKRHARNTHR
jgi:hypothetical protein